ncbi:VCBS repeat-containing protein [Streptomyces yaizuensis]|uniref:FG-GAP-like repeat-containing protein n=1 Tax=Streptomyces yaizuensis TaxID=2989713 RepID=A0ABQ5NXJ7_9ACTN|nr:VCBS repeat-containing protein [Streptomyces sp. YSPA8]GLF95082.1 FG-GAP-like repeat-containing protein [Streptomyces sp. YSPA8]
MSSRQNLRLAVATAAAAALTGGLLTGATAGAATAAPVKAPAKASAKASAKAPAKGAEYADDFNGDKIRDFVTGSHPGITLRYGVKGGDGTKPKHIDQNSPGIPGVVTRGNNDYDDSFGEVKATADFNQDGYADLAVSDPAETVGKRKGHGMVVVLWGSKKGLGAKATALPAKKSRADGYFGMALAAGDFNGDTKPDLAVADRDTVYLYRGGFSATTGKPAGAVTEHRPAGGKKIIPMSLVAGKVTRDKATDLYALGLSDDGRRPQSVTWFLKGGTTVRSGAYRTSTGAEPAIWAQGVIADFDQDGHGDLATNESQYKGYTGSVLVLRGSENGPAGSYRITQSTAGVATSARKDDRFGAVVSAGKVDGDKYPDLAVSAPGEKVGTTEEAGGVHILRGGPKGLTGTGSQWFTKNTAGIPGQAAAWDAFGEYMALRDMDHDGDADLYVSDIDEKTVLVKGGKKGLDLKSARTVGVNADFVQ